MQYSQLLNGNSNKFGQVITDTYVIQKKAIQMGEQQLQSVKKSGMSWFIIGWYLNTSNQSHK